MKFEVLPNKKKRITIIFVIVGIITIVGIATFSLTRAKYQYTKSIPLIRANNISYSKSDLEIVGVKLEQDDGTYIDSNEIPQSGYVINEINTMCKVNNIITEVKFKNIDGINYIAPAKKGTKCTLAFDKKKLSAADTLIAKSGSGGLSFINDQVGYRFQGASPNNYITYNDELWRIISIEEGSTIGLERGVWYLKIIRNESIGNISEYGHDGFLIWEEKSIIKKLLNEGDYYNRLNSYSNNGLLEDAKKMIESAKWFLGGPDSLSEITKDMYNYDRSVNLNQDRPATWFGEVGLMYISDYGYASPQATCESEKLSSYSTNCASFNWLFNNDKQWALTTQRNSNNTMIYVDANGNISWYYELQASVRPTLYLKSNVKILDNGKDGSSSKPYDLSL